MDQMDKAKLIEELIKVTALATFAQCLLDFKKLIGELPEDIRPRWEDARVVFRLTVQDTLNELERLQAQEAA